ncbi:MAG TPA: N-acyl homoserine lactonase family protein [Usitatibacter sp.]|nr:N-acyl homoserine lactonase family protein [Usitatibacter sp.]
MKKILAIAAIVLVSSCATPEKPKPPSVERMYVIPCGEIHTTDLSRWTPGENIGKPYVLSVHCYLVKHARGWMLWDSGHPERIAAMPNGLTNPQGTSTSFLRKTLTDSLREIGITPAGIEHFAMSHSHGDHSGNAGLFAASTIYMQQAEYDAVLGPDAAKFNLPSANFEGLKGARFVLLNGERDVFGDGSVMIKPAPGHTPGHQVLAVRLPTRGLVLLSGDLVHLHYNWERSIVPNFNYDLERSRRSISEMKEFVAKNDAAIWINHDREQHAAIPKAPAYVE